MLIRMLWADDKIDSQLKVVWKDIELDQFEVGLKKNDAV